MKDQAGNTIFDSSARVKPQNGLRRTTSRLATPPDMRQESRPSQLDSSSLDVPRPDLERIDTGVTRVHNPADRATREGVVACSGSIPQAPSGSSS
jgi:hypothetical protein